MPPPSEKNHSFFSPSLSILSSPCPNRPRHRRDPSCSGWHSLPAPVPACCGHHEPAVPDLLQHLQSSSSRPPNRVPDLLCLLPGATPNPHQVVWLSGPRPPPVEDPVAGLRPRRRTAPAPPIAESSSASSRTGSGQLPRGQSRRTVLSRPAWRKLGFRPS
jgi:hypothetical protein